jgi:CheY-like chemotaxis protein
MKEKRFYKRFNVQLSGFYAAKSFPLSYFETTVVDISGEGMSFLIKKSLPIGELVDLTIELEPNKKVQLHTSVRWIKKVNEEFQVGVEIVDASMSDEVNFIQYYCQKMLSIVNERKKILIIDDEKEIVELLRIELEHENYQVITAHDGEEGLKKYFDEYPHLIILDLNMPKLNGYGVCRNIRWDKGDTKTPILMLTAKKEDADRIIGRVMGAQEYMTKPFEIEKLLKEIERLLSIKGGI